MKDVITISTVTMNSVWGDKAGNLNQILGFVESAAKRGSDLVIFPEMSLTGYDVELEKDKKDMMQYKEAETIPGPSSLTVAELTKKYGIYALFGMPERDAEAPDKLYNSVAICGPDGVIGSYRKIHLPYPEYYWAERGEKPEVLDTPWGPIGVSVCYDTYCFPELMRYEVAKGARLHINCTAYAKCHGDQLGSTTIQAYAIINQIFIASSNLGGKDLYNEFWGGSNIVGPSRKAYNYYYYAGQPFEAETAIEAEMHTATINLALAKRGSFLSNPAIGGKTDYRPEIYVKLCQDLLEDPNFGKGLLRDPVGK